MWIGGHIRLWRMARLARGWVERFRRRRVDAVDLSLAEAGLDEEMMGECNDPKKSEQRGWQIKALKLIMNQYNQMLPWSLVWPKGGTATLMMAHPRLHPQKWKVWRVWIFRSFPKHLST